MSGLVSARLTVCMLLIGVVVGSLGTRLLIPLSATQPPTAATPSSLSGDSHGFALISATTYLTSDLGPTGACSGPNGYVPCFGGSQQSQAVVFSCLVQAKSVSGCSREVVSISNSQYRYSITIWIPVGDQSGPTSLNCFWQSSGDLAHYYYSRCVAVDSISFIVTEPNSQTTF